MHEYLFLNESIIAGIFGPYHVLKSKHVWSPINMNFTNQLNEDTSAEQSESAIKKFEFLL